MTCSSAAGNHAGAAAASPSYPFNVAVTSPLMLSSIPGLAHGLAIRMHLSRAGNATGPEPAWQLCMYHYVTSGQYTSRDLFVNESDPESGQVASEGGQRGGTRAARV